jgi:SAM-dependent methyltransferase
VDVDWSIMAPTWDHHREAIETMKATLTARLLEALAPLDGKRVLELGGGTGELAARLADAVGPTGSVLATDVAAGMVELLEKRLAAVPQAEVATVDAAAIDLPDDSFDIVVFRMGLMMVVEPDLALAGVRRVLRPGGRFATAVWGSPEQNPWMTTVGMSAMVSGLVSGGPPVGPGGPFSLADPDDLERRVRAAGFDEVTVETIETRRHFRDAEQQVEEVGALAPPLRAALSSASVEQRAAVVRQVAALTEQFRGDDGIDVPATSLLCVAR